MVKGIIFELYAINEQKQKFYIRTLKYTTMKKYGYLIASAVLGSVFSLSLLFVFQADIIQPKTKQIVHTEQDFIKKVSYEKSSATHELLDFTSSAEKVMPTVVHIETRVSVRTNAYPPGFDIWKEFFGPQWSLPQEESNVRKGSGSGVVVSHDGYIVTNNHVIQNADEIEITLHDKQKFIAKVIGSDPNTDIALLKIEAEELSPITFANSDEIKVGEWVLAVGNPFNLNSTVTAGIVSAKGRNINILKQQYAIESFIQTDAAINPGNSGGALTNIYGDLVGINTAIASPTGSYSGYGFAVPSNIVSKVIYDLKTYGIVQRGFLGVSIREVDSKFAEEKKLHVHTGVYIEDIMEKGAASKSNLQKSDVILAIDEIPVKTTSEIQEIIGRRSPGDVVAVKINRFGKEEVISVTLTNREGNVALTEKNSGDEIIATLGISVAEVDKKTLAKTNKKQGIEVTAIHDGLIRKHTSMRVGFIITQVDKTPITSVEQFMSVMKNKKGGVMIEGIYKDAPGVFYYAFGM